MKKDKKRYEHINTLYSEAFEYDEGYEYDGTYPKPILNLPRSFVMSMCMYISEVIANTRKIDILAKWMKPYVYNRLNDLRLQGYNYGNMPKVNKVSIKRLNTFKVYGICKISTTTGVHLISITYEVCNCSWMVTNLDIISEDDTKLICMVSQMR